MKAKNGRITMLGLARAAVRRAGRGSENTAGVAQDPNLGHATQRSITRRATVSVAGPPHVAHKQLG